jgi:myo-inositol-1(or 4)-monophosphatase
MAITKQYLEIIRAAKAGGKVVKKYFGKTLEIEGKSMPCDFRTKADLESEEVVLKILQKKFPTYNIISEEAGEINKNSEYTFVIDPLDGTNNFVLGIPYFSVGIGLIKGGEILFGAVYNPILNNMYFAEKGKGAYLNNKRIYKNDESDIKNSTVCSVMSYDDTNEYENKIIFGLQKLDVKRILKNWSCLLDFCLLATGKLEAVIFHNCPLHDFVSGKIIAIEAGAISTDFLGNAEEKEINNTFLTTNGTKIHKEILEILNK